jgi:hypothetical protein
MFPFKVYGINLAVRMIKDPPPALLVHCPRGSNMCYGMVVDRGDGFDEGGNAFRDMPPLGSLVVFEESDEGMEGHYFYSGDEEYRVLRLDVVIVCFPQEKKGTRQQAGGKEGKEKE